MTVKRTREEEILFMQSFMLFYLMKKWGIESNKFIELDTNYDIFGFIRRSYDALHLMGEDGIVLEIENFIKIQGGNLNQH